MKQQTLLLPLSFEKTTNPFKFLRMAIFLGEQKPLKWGSNARCSVCISSSPTRKRATALPKMNPAMTSEQWFRYSETRLSPVRNAAQRVPRHNTGLASLLLFVLIVLVMYIWNTVQTNET